MIKECETFGEDFNPAVSSTQIEVGQSFRCPCGHEISTSHGWLAAHWHEKTETTCPKCGQKFFLRGGIVRLAKKNGKWAKTLAPPKGQS